MSAIDPRMVSSLSAMSISVFCSTRMLRRERGPARRCCSAHRPARALPSSHCPHLRVTNSALSWYVLPLSRAALSLASAARSPLPPFPGQSFARGHVLPQTPSRVLPTLENLVVMGSCTTRDWPRYCRANQTRHQRASIVHLLEPSAEVRSVPRQGCQSIAFVRDPQRRNM